MSMEKNNMEQEEKIKLISVLDKLKELDFTVFDKNIITDNLRGAGAVVGVPLIREFQNGVRILKRNKEYILWLTNGAENEPRLKEFNRKKILID